MCIARKLHPPGTRVDVFGSTGNQSGSEIDYVLTNAELSNRHYLHGVTLYPDYVATNKPRNRGIEVAKGDTDDPDVIQRDLNGVSVAFMLTTY